MKHLLLACTLACASTLALAADPAPGPGAGPMGPHMMKAHGYAKNPDEHAARLKQHLQLSDEQTAKVKKILEAKQKDSQAIRDKYKPQLEAYHADKQKLRDKTHTDIEAVLTPEQKEKFKQHQMKGGMCDYKKGHGMHGGMGKHHGMMPPQPAPAEPAKPAASKT